MLAIDKVSGLIRDIASELLASWAAEQLSEFQLTLPYILLFLMMLLPSNIPLVKNFSTTIYQGLGFPKTQNWFLALVFCIIAIVFASILFIVFQTDKKTGQVILDLKSSTRFPAGRAIIEGRYKGLSCRELKSFVSNQDEAFLQDNIICDDPAPGFFSSPVYFADANATYTYVTATPNGKRSCNYNDNQFTRSEFDRCFEKVSSSVAILTENR